MTTPLKTKPTLINNKNLKGIKFAFQVFFLQGLFPFCFYFVHLQNSQVFHREGCGVSNLFTLYKKRYSWHNIIKAISVEKTARKMELYAIKYGETTLPESWVFEGGDKEKILPITFTIFLVKSETESSSLMRGATICPVGICGTSALPPRFWHEWESHPRT